MARRPRIRPGPWGDAAPPAEVQRAVDDPEAARVSLIQAAVRLRRDGLAREDIAGVLGVSTYKISQALKDPRAAIVERRLDADAADDDALHAAQSAYRLSRAWEVLDMEMDSSDPWIRHQAALAVIAASAKSSQARPSTEIVIVPELAYDDQDRGADGGPDMQDDGPDAAYSGDLMVIPDD